MQEGFVYWFLSNRFGVVTKERSCMFLNLSSVAAHSSLDFTIKLPLEFIKGNNL